MVSGRLVRCSAVLVTAIEIPEMKRCVCPNKKHMKQICNVTITHPGALEKPFPSNFTKLSAKNNRQNLLAITYLHAS